MKKLYLLLFLGVLAVTVTAQNLVLNGGFETWTDATTPTDWTKAENVVQESAAANIHSGTNSAKQTADGTKDIAQTFAVVGGKEYRLGYWYKNESGDGTDCRFWANWIADGTNLTDNADVLKPGTMLSSADWAEVSLVLTAPATATHFNFEVRSFGSAITYWDDLVFEEVVDVSEPDPIFFSEYIEGSSNNKALEIYNPGPDVLDLANYQVAQTSNGSDTTVWEFFHVFPEGATIEPYDVWVILNSSYDPALFDFDDADEVLSFPSPVHHNGDDARAIIYISGGDTTIIDVIGATGPDPGSGWDVAGETNATANHTLVRKDEVSTGTDDWLVSAGSNPDDSQWIVHASNESSYLGWHGPDMIAPKVTMTPVEGAVGVSVATEILIAFNEPVSHLNGLEITDPATLVVLKETDAAGGDVAFTASINADKDTITVTPDAALSYETLYYAALNDVVEDTAGNAIADIQTTTFTTIGPLEVTYPIGGEIFYPGEDVHIDWTTDLTENLTIWVSFDAGATWASIVADVDPAIGTVDYTIPEDSDASLVAMIRISKASDVTFVDVIDDSEMFNIVPMLSIFDIQSDVAGMYTDTVCLTSGVVTYIKSGDEYYISDGTGDYSAVMVDDKVNSPAVGDSVVIAGTVTETYGLTNIASLIAFTNIASGKPVPAPIDVTTGAAGEALEGVIVKLSSAKVVGETNSYGETEVDDGSGVILIDDPYYDATLNVDGTYDITGPLSYSFGKWRVYPTAAGDVVEIPSTIATVSSATYAVDDIAETIVDVPATTDLATLRTNLTPAYGATFEVYQADGTTIAIDLASDYKVIVTAQDASTTKTYTITLAALSSDATVTSMVYAVDGDAGTVDGVLFKATLASFEALLVAAPGATFETFQADGTTAATDIMTGYKLIVTAEDASTTKTYTVTVDDAMPADLIFSEYIEGSSNNKAIEIFNPNDAAVKMDYYQLAQISNGGDAWEYFHIFPVGTVLGSHETYVIITDETDVTMFAPEGANEVMGYPSPVHHNGDDARGMIIVTAVDTTLVDIIGTIGADPGDGWDVAGVTDATKDHTIIRKGTVMAGNTDWAASAGTNADNSEWIVKDQNFFDSLGVHTLVLPQPSDDATLSALMVDGTGVSGFSPAQLTYFVTLDAGTTATPAVTATATADGLASIDITDATDVNGDEAARTTSVTVTAEDGATMKTYTIVFDVEVGIDNSVFSNVMVYPVPSSSKLYIENVSEVQSLTVFDITGAAMMSIDNSGQELLTVDVSELSSGLYMVRMTSEKASGVIRFIKE